MIPIKKNFSKMANKLLEAALRNCEWNLVKELTRFFTAIDPEDLENDVFCFPTSTSGNPKQEGEKGQLSRKSSTLTLLSKKSSIIEQGSRERTTSTPEEAATMSKNVSKSKLSKAKSIAIPEQEVKRTFDDIINEHAFELLKKYSIKSLFEMFSNLNGLNLSKWLTKYQ